MTYMAISEAERKIFERVIAEVGSDPEKAEATLKVLFNVIKKTTPISVELQSEVKKILDQYPNQTIHAEIQKDLQKLGAILMHVAQEEEFGRTYSTGQLAKIFGVSITTINNWIYAGRFIGVERSQRNKQARISENTLWVSPLEERIPVREFAEIYEQKEQIEKTLTSIQDGNLHRIRLIVETIDFYEKRYGKPYHEVVVEKGNPDDSEDWIWAREGKEWKSLLKEIGDL
ncbi:hypothetical protein ACWKW1_15495 [Brevibacillus parabrevis]